MQYRFEIKPKLEKKLKKIEKKDPVMFKAVREKIFEIAEEEKMVRFLDWGHHDEIYRTLKSRVIS